MLCVLSWCRCKLFFIFFAVYALVCSRSRIMVVLAALGSSRMHLVALGCSRSGALWYFTSFCVLSNALGSSKNNQLSAISFLCFEVEPFFCSVTGQPLVSQTACQGMVFLGQTLLVSTVLHNRCHSLH